MKNKILPWIITFVALGLSSTAAYYSVVGLSKLFAGVATAVIIMASFLEASKLVIASLLFQYWKTINKLLRIYLTSALVILILITSVGIYGMLSGGYQETYSKLSLVENQKSFTQQKIDFYQTDINRYDKEIERISSNISTLSNAKVSTIQIQDAKVSGGVRSTISTTEIRMAQNRIKVEEENRKLTQEKRIIATDSLQKFQLQVLNLKNNNEQARELGPLKYISGLTGVSMDKIINFLILIIIFVFDPLAISLVISANFAFKKAYPEVENVDISIENNTLTQNVNKLVSKNVIESSKNGGNNYPDVQDLKELLKNKQYSSSTLKKYLGNDLSKIKLEREIKELENLINQQETKTY